MKRFTFFSLLAIILLLCVPTHAQWNKYDELDSVPGQTDDVIIRNKADTTMAPTGTQKRLEMHNLFLSRVSAKTANYTCTVDDNATTFTNYAATGQVIFTLPDCTSTYEGLWYVFMVKAAYAIRITPNANDSFRVLSPGETGEYITSDTTEGTAICLKCIRGPTSGSEADTYNWQSFGYVGTWTAQD